MYTRDARAYVFRQSTRAAVIITPSLPIRYSYSIPMNLKNDSRYNNINYYWYGNYVYDASHPLKCEYPIDLSADKEFQNVTYPDGSKPPSLQFGCLNYEDCCGLECCGDSRTSTVLICGIFLFLLATCVGYKKHQRYQIKKNDEMAMVTTNSALQPLLDDTNIEVHAV
ncbi:hypothetical protein CRE_19344 [Caenorhabditis remanei]|uniref:CX domain-containing protein n=1 Tax=Caenorhabditis remanei TaxID=31234 RepID=E3N533_CAERE|nr:hypothetical protein CRE_19344 [Caenorhabditis remanei]